MKYGQYFDLEKILQAGFSKCYMIPPMLISKIPAGKESKFDEICSSGDYMGSIKKDGSAYILEKTEDGKLYLFGRTVSKKNGLLTHKEDNVPHIIEAFKDIPNETIVVGEIYYPHKESKDVVSIMGCLPAKAIQRQQNNPIHYYIHDIIMYDGIDLLNVGAYKRYGFLLHLYNTFLSKYDFIELADCQEDDLVNYIHQALDSGEEGVVLRKKDAPYSPGKRPAWVTLKFKQHDTVDVVCMGFEEPTKEYYGKSLETWEYYEDNIPVTKPYYMGWKSAIKIGCYDNDNNLISIGTVSSGLNEELQAAFGEEDADKYIGQVVEIECMSKNKKDHTLRHPYFVTFRSDKDPHECTFEGVFK